MASSDRKLGNAVGAKSARACDNCVKKRARWYCTADDAFLCQSCDSSVHSANTLARRHERVRLKTASFKPFDEETPNKPSWHQGFTRKARTPRLKRQINLNFNNNNNNNPLHLIVPEIECSNDGEMINEDQLLYQVPIFDPFVAELCDSNKGFEFEKGFDESRVLGQFGKLEMNGFIDPSEMDLAEFAADVESLLGTGLEEESFDMELGLGFLEKEEEMKECLLWRVKDEEINNNNNHHHQLVVDDDGDDVNLVNLGSENFELNFDYDDDDEEEEEDVKAQCTGESSIMTMNINVEGCNNNVESSKRKMFLRLDYEGVLSSWDSTKSPWTNGERPDLDADECWRPDCMGSCGTTHVYGDMGMSSGHATAMTNGDREARVSRYREKRRTRLFSKKIRYQVRKLNAEKRPRMKGRFVKRSNLVTAPVLPVAFK